MRTLRIEPVLRSPPSQRRQPRQSAFKSTKLMQNMSLKPDTARSHPQATLRLVQGCEGGVAPTVAFSSGDIARAKANLERKNRRATKALKLKSCCKLAIADDRQMEPETREAGPPAPSYLTDPIALKEWKAIAPLVEQRGLLDEATTPLLVGYCVAVARSIKAEMIIEEEGRYYKTITNQGSSIRRRHPAVQDAEKGWETVRRFAKDLGIIGASSPNEKATGSSHAMFK